MEENKLKTIEGELEAPADFTSPDVLYRDLVANIRKYHPSDDLSMIEKAYQLADNAHKDQKRKSGEPYIIHPLCVAIILADLEMDKETIVAGMLHDVVEDTDYTVEDIENIFGPKIAQIVDGLTKISGGIFGDRASAQAENFKKLLLTMSDDIRVILIKIADRLHNMRTLGSMLPNKQFKIAGETLYIYAPLANRLGLYKIKTELENLSFRYEHPEEYHEIEEKLAATAVERDKVFKEFTAPIRAQLDKMGLKYRILARIKSIYSIWNKMQTKHVPFEEIYDLLAVRIIFEPRNMEEELNDCFDIYVSISKIYKPHPDRLRDWVSHPKANGYQALHVTLMGNNGQWIEVQIRSERMNDVAEQGFAAHWKYKEHNIEEDTELDKWLQTITEILESPDPNALDFLDTIKLNLFTSEIFVFTPKGDIKTLPQGATALDFGYALHSDIGNKCIGAKVNHRLVPLSHQLASGDQVEILTSRSQNPQPEWLNFVTTARARARIDAYLKRIRKEAAKEGEIKVIDAFKRNNLEANTSNIDKLCMYFGFSKREEFYYAVEKGDVILPENIHKLLKEKTDNVLFKYVKQALRVATKATTGKKEEEEQPKEKPKYDKKKPYILKEEAFERNYVIADCCKPIPGDESLGFINDDGNVVVHKRSCPIAMRLKSSFGERILNTEWSSHHSSFEATLEIKGIDSIGVLNTITRTISDDFNVNIIRLLIEAKDGVFEGKVKMKVHDVEDIQRMCVVLSKIKNIQSVARVAD